MRYRRVVLPRKGPPEVLTLVEEELRAPGPGEARVRVEASGVGYTDVIMRRGFYLFAPAKPFSPGYELVGRVDAIGDGVAGLAVGQRVAALVVTGGWSEYAFVGAEHLVPVPDALDAAEVAALVLNYVTAYQMLHRVARVQAGQTAFVSAAAGGVGTALLQLGRLAGLARMHATASVSKHALVEAEGGLPIDYRAGDFVAAVRAREPDGVDAAFEAVGGPWVRRASRVVRRGGTLTCYGMVAAGLVRTLAALGVVKLSRGGRASFYGITALYRKDPRPFLEDLPKLLQLLGERRLRPVIAARLPLDQAAHASALVERGEVQGKIVLVP